MPKITESAMSVVADLLNTHAVKMIDADKKMVMAIGMAYKLQYDVDQETYDAWHDRIILIRQVVTHA